MRFLTRWFNRKIHNALSEGRIISETTASNSSRLNSSGMNFSVYKANGGFIIEYHYYDRHRDRSENKLHIVTEDKDLGEELGKIISFETLRS
jgi:hypothetical protein